MRVEITTDIFGIEDRTLEWSKVESRKIRDVSTRLRELEL